MHTKKKALIVINICLFLMGCTALPSKYYSYASFMSTVNSVESPKLYSHLVSYEKYLFEFNIKTYIVEEQHLGDPNFIPKPRITGYDTLSVYLLSGKNRLFYEFDTFAIKTKIIKVGKWDDKPSGQSLTSETHKSDTQFVYGPLQKEMINNISCFVAKVAIADKTMSDSLSWEVVLIKNAQLNSFFKLTDNVYPDKNYCIVGYRTFDRRLGDGLLIEIENLRPLNEKEITICKNMVEIMKTTSTDTVGNYKK